MNLLIIQSNFANQPYHIGAIVNKINESIRFFIFEESYQRIGDIYVGQITHIDNSFVWVDIGHTSTYPISNKRIKSLSPGQFILCKIIRLPFIDAAHRYLEKGIKLKLHESENISSCSHKVGLFKKGPHPIEATLSFYDINEIIVQTPAIMAWVKQYTPSGCVISHHNNLLLNEPEILEDFECLKESVLEYDECRIFINETPIGVIIDINAKKDKLKANIHAVKYIVKSIAHRNLAGPIIIDFAGVDHSYEKNQIEKEIKHWTKYYQLEKLHYLGWTRLNHLELSRPKYEPSLTEKIKLLGVY